MITWLSGPGSAAPAQPPQLLVQEGVATLTALLTESQAALRHYEWMETTIVSLHGEVKSRKQERCHYGPNGTLERADVSRDAGRVVRPTDFTPPWQNALSLVNSYIPLNASAMQAAKRAGRITVTVLQPGKHARVNILDYYKVGDQVGIEIDLANNRISRVTVTTYLDNITDVVTLNAKMAQLSDGVSYASAIMLEDRMRSLNVAVQDTGYRIPN